MRFLPFTDLRSVTARGLLGDANAALGVTFLAVPQGIAYAIIAGLPPVMGLYAAAVPVIVGSLLRSSRHVITGPTNALSLLVGAAVLNHAGIDPVVIGVTLAVMVGLFQIAAGVLRLGAVVDYISKPVVLGYITGAALLIVLGQLTNATQTTVVQGHRLAEAWRWLGTLPDASTGAILLAAATAAGILGLRALSKRVPAAMLSLGAATAASMAFDFSALGFRTVQDLAPVPAALPPLSLPDWSVAPELLGAAVACTVMSLVESSSVARAISVKTGQTLDPSVEFAGQGFANLISGLFGGYPISGSLSRSALNASAPSRLSGIISGFLLLATLLFLGPFLDATPIAALAGLLFVVAFDIVDLRVIKRLLRTSWPDAAAFAATLAGTLILSLDTAIYLGVGISIVLFLRRARLLIIHELGVDPKGHVREIDAEDDDGIWGRCAHVRMLHLEGRLFFGVEGELQTALDAVVREPKVRVVLLRLKRTQGMDATVAGVLRNTALLLRAQGRHLLLAGVRADTIPLLDRAGVTEAVGAENLFASQRKWFGSMNAAMQRALELSAEQHDEDCPLLLLTDATRPDAPDSA
jgi:sulfate permease, SulP family